MFSVKRNSTMEGAMGLISSLLDVALSQEMPFHQPQQLHSVHHGATFVLCVLFFPYYHIGVDLWWASFNLRIS